MTETSGTSIHIFLVDGTPDGLRLVERSNWTGQAVVVSRAEYADVRTREEFAGAGVYILVGPAEDSSKRTLYVGEGDNIRARLDQHIKHKEFWTQAVVFRSKDRTLNKAYIKYLEARLVDLATEVARWSLDNSTVPQLPSLAESERADNESFLADMLLIYPILGVDAFEVPGRQSADTLKLHLSGPDASGEGFDRPEGFVVLAGGMARTKEAKTFPASVKSLREDLLENGALVSEGSSLELTKDFTFSSPSAAAAMLLGRSANGRTEWKDDSGLTLKEIQDAAVEM